MKIVLDTNVVLTAMRSRSGASAALLRAVRQGRAQMLVSVPLFLEYESVLTREEHLEAAGLAREEAEAILDALASLAKPVELYFLWRPQLRDPGDDMVLETATNGGADALVTYNLRDFAGAAGLGVHVARPLEILERIRG